MGGYNAVFLFGPLSYSNLRFHIPVDPQHPLNRHCEKGQGDRLVTKRPVHSGAVLTTRQTLVDYSEGKSE